MNYRRTKNGRKATVALETVSFKRIGTLKGSSAIKMGKRADALFLSANLFGSCKQTLEPKERII